VKGHGQRWTEVQSCCCDVLVMFPKPPKYTDMVIVVIAVVVVVVVVGELRGISEQLAQVMSLWIPPQT